MGQNGGDVIDADMGDGVERAIVGKHNQQNAASNVLNITLPDYARFQQSPQESADEYQRRMIIELERKTQEKFNEIAISLNTLTNTIETNSKVGKLTNELLERQIAEVVRANESTRSFVVESLKGLLIVPAPEKKTDEPAKPLLPLWMAWAIIFFMAAFFLMGIGAMFYLTMGGK